MASLQNHQYIRECTLPKIGPLWKAFKIIIRECTFDCEQMKGSKYTEKYLKSGQKQPEFVLE